MGNVESDFVYRSLFEEKAAHVGSATQPDYEVDPIRFRRQPNVR